MSIFKKISEKLKGVKERTEEIIVSVPAPEKKGYFNGLCPECNEHIGVWVCLESERKGIKVEKAHRVHCPCCGKEIFPQVEVKVEWDRI